MVATRFFILLKTLLGKLVYMGHVLCTLTLKAVKRIITKE